MKNKIIILIYAIVLIFFIFAIVPKQMQNDTFFSIASGNNYLENGLTNKESLVWHENLEFTNSRWLFDVIIAKIYNTFNFSGVYYFVIILSCIQALIYYSILNKISNRSFLSFILTAITMLYASGEFAGRAQIISFSLFMLEFYFVDILFNTGKKRYMIFLGIICVLLANIHASVFPMYFVFFLPYIAEYLVYLIKEKLIKNKKENEKYEIKKGHIKELLIILVVAIFLAFLTPNGITVYTDLIKVLSGSTAKYINELKEISLLANPYFSFLIMLAIGLVGFTKTKIRISDICFIAGFFVMSLAATRASYYFYFISTICIFRILFEVLKDYEVDFRIKYKPIIVITVLVILIWNAGITLKNKISQEYIDFNSYPVGAAKEIKDTLDIKSIRIFNTINIGSYLEFTGIKAFFDTRTGIFTPEFNEGCHILEDGMDIAFGNRYYGTVFDKYDITHVIIPVKSTLNNYLPYDDKWEMIYKDNYFVLYENINYSK